MPPPPAAPPKKPSKYDVAIPDIGAGHEVKGGSPSADLFRKFHPAERPVEEIGAPASAALAQSPPGAAEEMRQFAIPEYAQGAGQSEAERFEQASRISANKAGLGDRQGALEEADRLIALEPWNSGAHLFKANLLNQARRFEEAELEAGEAVRRDPSNADAWSALGWAQLNQAKYTDAERNLTEAIRLLEARRAQGEDGPELRSALASAYAMRAFAYEGLGQREKMLADLERAAQLDSKRFSGHLARAKAGRRLFDPSDKESWRLLDELPAGEDRASSPWLFALAALTAVAGGLGYAYRGRLGALFLKRDERIRREMTEALAPEPAPAPKEAGLLSDKYSLKLLKGKDALGEVWQAVDNTLGRPVSVKKMAPELVADAKARERVLADAHTAAGLQHPNIAAVYEVLDLREGVILIGECPPGQTVRQLLELERRLPPARVKDILNGACKALEFAHGKGFMHRNLNVANILVTDGGTVKLLDFGLSPGEASAAADIRALGACLYEMLTGEPLPAGGQHRPLPPAAAEIVARASGADPAQRFAGVHGFASALARL